MSTIPAEPATEFWKICDDQGNCHCDWRLTIYGCFEEKHMRPLYIALAAISGVVGLGAVALVHHRAVVLNQSIFDFRGKIPRPKPIESMAVFGAMFNLLRMVHAIILVTDVAPNVAFRSFLFEFPWQFGIGALSCYLFGIAHTLADSSRVLYNTWVRTPIVVDCLGIMIIVLPFVTNNLCAIAAGVFALQGGDNNNELAARLTAALYYFWTFYTGFLALLIFVAGTRLLRLLRNHLLEHGDSRADVGKVKLGALKVKIIVFAGVGCLSAFVVIMVLYGRLRDPITRNTGYNVAMAVLWMFDGVITTAVVEFGVVLNPRIATLATGFGSSNDKTTSATGRFQSTYHLQQQQQQHPHVLSITTATSATIQDASIETLSPTSCKFGMPSKSTSTWGLNSKSRFLESEEFTLAGSDPSRSQIDEQQFRYNVLTSSARAPPPPPLHSSVSSSATEDRLFPVDPITIDTTDASTTSSATFLAMYGR